MTYFDHYEEESISNLFVGRRIVEAEHEGYTGRLALDDGTELRIVGISACCAHYDVTHLATTENVITRVVFSDTDNDEYGDATYSIFVYAEGIMTEAVRLEGTDGSGYYGTGYSIRVTRQGTNEHE